MPRVVIIRNPASRNAVDRATLESACAALDATWEIEIVDSTRSLGVAAVARDAALSDVDYVLACGGDGTLNEVLNGVVSAERPDVVVGLIPAGTANVWAREARIPRDPASALQLLASGAVVSVDVGRVRVGRVDRAFLLMCSIGVDAAVVAEVERRTGLKRRLARAAYVVAGAPALWRYESVQVEIDGAAPGDPIALAVVGNSRLYGGLLRLTSQARMDDGLLDLALFRVRRGPRRWLDLGAHLLLAASRLRRPHVGVMTSGRYEYRRGQRFSLLPRAAISVQADGEFLAGVEAGEAIRFEAEPRAVRMLVPPAENPLFALALTPRSA